MTRDAEPLSQGRFRGRATQSRDSERFTIGHWFANNPDGSTHPHSHEAAHFLWITSGRFESETATPNRSLPPIIYTPADIVHSDRFIGNGSFFSVSVANDTLWEIKDFRPPDRALQPHSWRARWILRDLLRLCGSTNDRDDGEIQSLCFELLSEICQFDGEAGIPGWFRRFREQVRESYGESLSVNGLARDAGVHPIHLTRVCRKLMGCTPLEYIRYVRLSAAAEALRRDEISICDVAFDTGFADQSHLNHAFRSAYGAAPGQFRRQLNATKR
ncbi:MAG: AraC family transcriptional regulator [Sphingobium sp.]